jgi:hypothetical protein
MIGHTAGFNITEEDFKAHLSLIRSTYMCQYISFTTAE